MKILRYQFIVTFIVLILFIGCLPEHDRPTVPTSKTHISKPSTHTSECPDKNSSYQLYNIYVDGKDIGRELRSTSTINGPMGEEIIILSHFSTQHKTNTVELDRFTVSTYRFLTESNTFLRGSIVKIDDATVHLSLVGYNGVGWERISENRESVTEPISTSPKAIHFDGTELFGFKLVDHLKAIGLGEQSPLQSLNYYTPNFSLPILLDFTQRRKGTYDWNHHKVDGFWVTAVRSGTSRIVLRVFVSTDGRVLYEEYPASHQIRILQNSPKQLPKEYTDPYFGLYSNAYLGLPNLSTYAKYEIITDEQLDFESLAFIGEPKNQILTKKDDHTLELIVEVGGPDGFNEPTQKDLAATKYINTNDKLITKALLYLKTAGKIGSLPKVRRENAIPIVAKASRISRPAQFWNSPDKVARLLMEYVHAILPDKHHTHTMKSSVFTLQQGMGDCTEHSVLFAALMRAAKIPTRLVSGIYLSHGGSWVFHMWNEYWDGIKWKSIDTAVGPTFSPGAHYIALGLGASNFIEHRNKIAFFLDHSFSGMSINLVDARSNGETLHLARPKKQHFTGHGATIFNAATFISRGDYKSALSIVEQSYQPDSSPLTLALIKSELLYLTGNFKESQALVSRIREQTSLLRNILFLDILSFKIALELDDQRLLANCFDKLSKSLKDDERSIILYKAMMLHKKNRTAEAIDLLEGGLITYPDDIDLTNLYVIYSAALFELNAPQIKKAIMRANQSIYDTHYADVNSLKAWATLLFTIGRTDEALSIIEHALILAPKDSDLIKLKGSSNANCQSEKYN